MIMKVCIGILVGIGLFMILADCFRIPYMRTSKAVNNLAKHQKDKTNSFDVWLSSIASFIARKIRLNEFKKTQLEADLRIAQMNITPEMFMANAIVKSLIVGVLAIPVFFIFPVLSPVIVFLAFILYRINMKGIANRIRAKRAKIEYELPRFVFKIEKSLMHSKDILEMIESFARNTNDELKHELDITGHGPLIAAVLIDRAVRDGQLAYVVAIVALVDLDDAELALVGPDAEDRARQDLADGVDNRLVTGLQDGVGHGHKIRGIGRSDRALAGHLLLDGIQNSRDLLKRHSISHRL